MSPSSKPATVRFYIDADVLGLAKVLVALRPDVTYPGDPGGVVHRRERPACVIADRGTPDTVWIPEVARSGWLIVTRDSRISESTAEIDAVRTNGARMIGAVQCGRKDDLGAAGGLHEPVAGDRAPHR